MRPSSTTPLRPIISSWRDEIILTRELTAPDERRAFYRRATLGDHVRVAPGAFVAAGTWAAWTHEERHLARCRAVALLRPGVVFSHASAALIHGLPLTDGVGGLVDVVGTPRSGGRSRAVVRVHATQLTEPSVRIGDLETSSLADTVVQVAQRCPLEVAVPVADAALARVPELDERLQRRVGELEVAPGSARARAAVAFADGRAGSPGESLSRVAIHRLGFPAPVLQHPFEDDAGLIGVVDFWWPSEGVIGEFDGEAKYVRPEYTKGRSPAEVIVAEKWREDRLRALGPRVVRWGWGTARSRTDLRALLVRAGLRPRR